VKKVVQELQQYEGAPLPGILVLFGSFAAENFTDQSDIDILAITGASFDQLALREIGAVIGREINVKTMTESTFVKGIRHPLPFVQEVTKCHVVLQGIDRFCSLMWNGFGIWRR
jgi:predicted nucleotidyltransferase